MQSNRKAVLCRWNTPTLNARYTKTQGASEWTMMNPSVSDLSPLDLRKAKVSSMNKPRFLMVLKTTECMRLSIWRRRSIIYSAALMWSSSVIELLSLASKVNLSWSAARCAILNRIAPIPPSSYSSWFLIICKRGSELLIILQAPFQNHSVLETLQAQESTSSLILWEI